MRGMATRFAVLTIALVFFCGTGVHAASNPSPGAPVTVQGCAVDGKWGTLDVHFTNVGPQMVKRVHFALMSESGALGMVNDVGSFAPGDVVQHRLRVAAIYLEMYADIHCVPATVTLEDGTVWHNPAVAAEMVHALPQTTGSQIAFSRCFIGDGVDMWFTNTASQAATEVDLGMVQQRLLVYELRNKGTFTPGVLIQRGYGSVGGKGNAVGDDVMHTGCIVLAVRYADGTSWKNPSIPPLSLKGVPLTVDPDAQAPVTVTGCDASSANAYDPNGQWRMSYENSSSKPIVAADFALVMHGYIQAVARDLHNLGPGGTSSPRFLQWDPHVYHPKCVPLRVSYADGTQWENPLFAAHKAIDAGR